MHAVILVARLLLVVVFAVAGAAKLADLDASRDTIEAFGLPRRLARYGGTALPVAELAAAVALLPQASTRWGAVAALALLLVFNGGVAYALSQGRTPNCNCFGQVSSEQISWRTLARNGVLALIAALAIWKAPGSSLSAWTTNRDAANLVGAFAIIAASLLAITAFNYRRRPVASLAEDVDGAPFGDVLLPGDEAPDFELQDIDGALVSRDTLLARGLPLVLVFASPACGPCQAMMPDVARWHTALRESITLVVVESGVGKADALRRQLRALGDFPVLVEPGRDVAHAYRVRGTPSGLAVSPEGRVASPPLPGAAHIEDLIRTVLRTGGAVPTPTPAAAIPAGRQ